MMPEHAILLCLLAPLGGAVLTLALAGRDRLDRGLVIAATALSTIASLVLVGAVQQGSIPAIRIGGWPAPHGIVLATDGLSALMLAVSNITALAVAVYAWRGADGIFGRRQFHPLFLTLLLGVNGAFLTTDLFNLYVWFEVLLLSSFVLMSLARGKEGRDGAWRYVLLNLVSSVLFLAAAGLIYGKTGTLNFAHLAALVRASENALFLESSAALLFCALAIKSALIPFAFWLPASYPAAPVAVSALFAGLLTKVGVYAFFRCFGMVFSDGGTFALRELLLPLAILTMAGGVLGAVAQGDMRRILSFHIISQVGYMVLALALFTPLAVAAGIFYIVHHIVVKTNLFLVTGMVEHAAGSSRLASLSGIARATPVVAFIFMVAALSLAGIPPLSGFWAKFALLAAALDAGAVLSAFAILGVGLLTLFSMVKIWTGVFWGADPEEGTVTSPARSLVAPGLALAAVTVAIGLLAAPVFRASEAAATTLLQPAPYIGAVLGPGFNVAMTTPAPDQPAPPLATATSPPPAP